MSKARAAGVSASSFFDLKAELAKHENDFAKGKAAGKTTAVLGVKKPNQKPTVWGRQNKGVKSRAARDLDLEAVSKPTLDAARAALERKAKIYEKLRKGHSGGLNEKQYDMLLVDFDGKADEPYESDSDDVDESLEVPKAPLDGQDDPIVEYEDEFGRVRTARRSEVPRHIAFASQSRGDDDEDLVIRNPVNHFPIYQPTAEREAEIAAAFSEEANPLGQYYDGTNEVRAKAAGFYQFSADEETRRQQMEELKSAREETLKTRQETGAVDVIPGQVEGMQDDGTALKSRAMEKRKRQLEERRRQVEAKRRKLPHGEGETPAAETPNWAAANTPTPSAAVAPPSSKQVEKKGKIDPAPSDINNDANAFLAVLERDILRGGES